MSSKRFFSKTPSQIAEILDVIHDWWFEKDDVEFDAETSTLNIKFQRELTDRKRVVGKKWFLKKVEVRFVECFLRIYRVKFYSINDTKTAGFYYRNELEYDPKLKRITLTSVGPIGVEVTVEAFEVSVEETDKVAEVKTVTCPFS